MRQIFYPALAACLAACSQSASGSADGPDMVTVFYGGVVRTGVPGAEPVEAVAVSESGLILHVGRTSDVTRALGVASLETPPRHIETVDLGEAVLFPGFTDAHAHLIGIGQREVSLDLSNVSSLAELVSRVEVEVAEADPGAIISGRGWIETDWPEARMPQAADLDVVSPDNPVVLVRADGHALVANTAALSAAGVSEATPDPDGGMIERGETGSATGMLIDNAMGLALALIVEPSEQDLERAYELGANVYVSRGWTGVHNMSVDPGHAPLLQRLAQEDRLPIRIYNAFDETGFDLAANRAYETPTITNRAVKIYMDGALGSRGALLSEPYSDRPDTSGLALRGRLETQALMLKADQANVQLAIHAIGDLANTRALDWIEDIFADRASGPRHRWRIEHAQVLAPSDIPRFAELSVIASMQPSHAIGDLKFAPARLGDERLSGAYAWRSLIDAGAVIAAGSDAPVEVGSPLIEFYAAVARKDLGGESGPDWRPEEAVTREEALQMLTLWPAYASFRENELGTVEPGKIADFTVFDRDLMTVPEAEILQARPTMTIIGGDIVWRAADDGA